MTKWLWICVIASLSTSLTAHAENEAPVQLTLEQAVDDGIRGATEVLKSNNQIEITAADLLHAYGDFLPNLAANASYGYSAGRALNPASAGIIDSRYHGGDYLISSTLNIFNGFGDVAFLDSSQSRKKAAHLTLDRVRQMIALDISQAYWQVELDQDLAIIAAKNLDISKSRQELMAAQKNVGQLNAADLYRQQAQTASDQATWIIARDREHIDLLMLVRRIRLDARKNYELVTTTTEYVASTSLPDESSLIDDALHDREDYKAQHFTKDAASSDVTFAARTYYPTLDLVASLDGEAREYSELVINGASALPTTQRPLLQQFGDQTTESLLLTLNWEIFGRWLTTSDIRKAKASESNANIDLEDLGNQVAVDVRQALTEYKGTFDQLVAAEAGVKAAQKAFELITGRYKLGASNFLDLVSAQAALVQAQATHAQARIGLRLGAQALNTALGRAPLGPLPRN
jgi:outer membrane protein